MRRALLCACSEYRDPAFTPLKYPLNDIEEIRHLLEEPELCGFEDIETLANPGRGEAHEAVEHLTADSSRDDLILFYFSGHGKLAQDGSVSLVLSDTKENRLHSTGLLDDQLRVLFNASRARQRVIILDCCYSGAVGEEGFKRASDDAVETMAHQIKGTFILAASTKFQPAMECAETKGSAFTSCLVEGVRTGAAAEKDSGCVTLAKLGEYLAREVPLRSNQQPKFWDFGGVGGTVIARVPSRFDAAWTEQTLKRLRQMMAREQIDDTLFVELQRVLRGPAGEVAQDRLVLIDDLAQRRMKPVPFLRKWQAPSRPEETIAERPVVEDLRPEPVAEPSVPRSPPVEGSGLPHVETGSNALSSIPDHQPDRQRDQEFQPEQEVGSGSFPASVDEPASRHASIAVTVLDIGLVAWSLYWVLELFTAIPADLRQGIVHIGVLFLVLVWIRLWNRVPAGLGSSALIVAILLFSYVGASIAADDIDQFAPILGAVLLIFTVLLAFLRWGIRRVASDSID